MPERKQQNSDEEDHSDGADHADYGSASPTSSTQNSSEIKIEDVFFYLDSSQYPYVPKPKFMRIFNTV